MYRIEILGSDCQSQKIYVEFANPNESVLLNSCSDSYNICTDTRLSLWWPNIFCSWFLFSPSPNLKKKKKVYDGQHLHVFENYEVLYSEKSYGEYWLKVYLFF